MSQCFLQLGELFVQVVDSPGGVGIFEPGRGRSALDLARVDQGGQVAWDVVEDPFPPLLLALEALPALAHGAGASGGFAAEHVRMTLDQLHVHAARNLL